MTPPLTDFYIRDYWLCNMVHAGYGCVVNSVLKHGENIYHVLFGKFCVAICGPSLSSSLFDRIKNIVIIRAKKQMIHRNAKSVVAFVEAAKAVWNWTVAHNPRCTVGENQGSSCRFNTPVTITKPSSPKPARLRLFDLRPESLWESFVKSLRGQEFFVNLYLHVKFELIAGAGLFQQRRFISFQGASYSNIGQ